LHRHLHHRLLLRRPPLCQRAPSPQLNPMTDSEERRGDDKKCFLFFIALCLIQSMDLIFPTLAQFSRQKCIIFPFFSIVFVFAFILTPWSFSKPSSSLKYELKTKKCQFDLTIGSELEDFFAEMRAT
jgi:hypothetical protein